MPYGKKIAPAGTRKCRNTVIYQENEPLQAWCGQMNNNYFAVMRAIFSLRRRF
jgi:hypothetical protein